MFYSLGMLSADDLTLLQFEASAPRAPGAKEEAIRATFGISPVRYYQRLNLIIDTPEAMKINPTLVSRLRRRAGKID
ncbi:MAG: DUF3263 domain-containing protein [Corynebacterium sp.]|nr:DUF3263 domain-containing protein [Corynebacterium sp.]